MRDLGYYGSATHSRGGVYSLTTFRVVSTQTKRQKCKKFIPRVFVFRRCKLSSNPLNASILLWALECLLKMSIDIIAIIRESLGGAPSFMRDTVLRGEKITSSKFIVTRYFWCAREYHALRNGDYTGIRVRGICNRLLSKFRLCFFSSSTYDLCWYEDIHSTFQ